MKTRYIIALSILAAAVSCNKTEQLEPQAPGDLVTITAILPDAADVKGAGLKTSLSWTWNEGDKITVIGETTETFRIKEGFGPKKAEFVGKAVKGSSFTILYPGLDANESDWNAQVQKGNNDMSHLKYQAALNNVDEYTTFAFNGEWAEAHMGTLKQTGVLKLTLSMPAGMTQPESVSVSADEPIFFSGNAEESQTSSLVLQIEDCTVAEEELVAWFTTSWNEAAVAAGTTLYVMISGEGKTYSRDVIIPKASALKTGFVNLFTLAGDGWADEAVNAHYAGGKGTQAAPWIIQTKEQMSCMAGDMVDGSIRYYKLDADVDLTGESWTSLNGGEGNKQYISLDGANHSIKGLSTSLFAVLVGSVKDLVIEDASVDGGAAIAGILANTVGEGVETSIVNVDIKNSSITGTTYVGGLLGESDVVLTISDCDVINTNASGTLTGGVVGFANNKMNMARCSYQGGTVTASARYAGGLVGSVGQFEGTVISDCSVKDAIINSTADRVGGAIGQLQQKTQISKLQVENTNVKGKQNVGGAVGVCYGSVSGSSVSGGKIECTNTGNSTAANLGGFAGYFQHGTMTACSASASIGEGLSGGAVGANMGGLVGNFQKGTIEKCYATGYVAGSYRYVGGLVGIADTAEDKVITDCYCTGNVSANSYTGGLIGGHNNGKLTVTRCYASGDVNASGFAAGGLMGYIKLQTVTVEKSVAWNAQVTATSIGETNWSSAAVVGVAFPTCTLTDNYRNPAMVLTAFWVPDATYQHANVSAGSPLIKQDGTPSAATALSSGQDGYPHFPYHGKVEAGKTLSQLASTTLGWSSDTWDFSGDTPKLK